MNIKYFLLNQKQYHNIDMSKIYTRIDKIYDKMNFKYLEYPDINVINDIYKVVDDDANIVIVDNLDRDRDDIDSKFDVIYYRYQQTGKTTLYFYDDLESYEILRTPGQYRVCCDVDGVLAYTRPQKDYKNSEPIVQHIQRLNNLYWRGAHITLHTARYMMRGNSSVEYAYEHGYMELVNWCEKNFVYYDNIVMGKPSAEVYIDDKACLIDSVGMCSNSWLNDNYLNNLSAWRGIEDKLEDFKNANI